MATRRSVRSAFKRTSVKTGFGSRKPGPRVGTTGRTVRAAQQRSRIKRAF